MAVKVYSTSQMEDIKNYLDSLGSISDIDISVNSDEVLIVTK